MQYLLKYSDITSTETKKNLKPMRKCASQFSDYC